MKIAHYCLTILLFTGFSLKAQNTFEGSFKMDVTMAQYNNMTVNGEFYLKNDKMLFKMFMMENLITQMLFDSKANTGYILNQSDKTATKMDLTGASAAKPEIVETGEKKVIDGYHCRKVTCKTDGDISEIWVTEEVPISFNDISKALSQGKSNSGMPSGFKGFPIEINVTSAKSGDIKMKFRDFKKEAVDSKIYDISGYTVTSAPATGGKE